MQCCIKPALPSSRLTLKPKNSSYIFRHHSISPIRAQASNKASSSSAPLSSATKLIAATAAAVALTFGPVAPSIAALDTDTYHAGPSATIESSNLKDQSPQDIVRALKEEVIPGAEQKLSQAAERSGGNYPQSVVQELEVVKGEIDALERQLQQGDGSAVSNAKSTASGIEQQINTLKALLGFD